MSRPRKYQTEEERVAARRLATRLRHKRWRDRQQAAHQAVARQPKTRVDEQGRTWVTEWDGTEVCYD